MPPKGYTFPTMQLFVMDEDGSNVEAIAPMTVSSVLHPTVLRDGRILFATHEDQGLRDRRQWGIWAMYPDGRAWEPVLSAFRPTQSFHFTTQLGSGDVMVVDYYPGNNNGFGALYRIPLQADAPGFHPAFEDQNPEIGETYASGGYFTFRMPFTPLGLLSLTEFTHSQDAATAFMSDGTTRVGKFTHPAGAPGDDLLAVWTPVRRTTSTDRRPFPITTRASI